MSDPAGPSTAQPPAPPPQPPTAQPRLPTPATALRDTLREGYTLARFRADLVAGLIVGIVALPLAMALAIATGVAPQNGLYTAIVAGAVTAVVGGSRVQVSGPTAAFVVVLVPIVQQHGPGGLMLATMMAGAILFLLGLARLGRMIQFLPYPVVTGFTAGIAVVIAVGQVKDLLGLRGVATTQHFHETVLHTIGALPTLQANDTAIGFATLALLLLLPRVWPRLPSPLVAVGGTALAAHGLHSVWPDFTVATIGTRFTHLVDGVVVPGMPAGAPSFAWPWQQPDANGAPLGLQWATVKALMPSAVVIALLGAMESLLSAVASDAMCGHKHDPDAELLAQGTGNLLAPLFGGFASTGAIARTATNVRAGATSPIASVVHAGFLLLAMVFGAPLLDQLPLAAMAALLLVVAWRMSDVRHFVHVLHIAPRSDVLVLMTCFTATVVFDMVVGVVAGFVLASLLFLRSVAELTGVRLVREHHPLLQLPIPPEVVVYEVDGPLFFGAAEKAMTAMHTIQREARLVVLDLDGALVIDATGLVNLQSLLDRLQKSRVVVVLTGIHVRLVGPFERAGIVADDVHLFVRDDIPAGLALANELLARGK